MQVLVIGENEDHVGLAGVCSIAGSAQRLLIYGDAFVDVRKTPKDAQNERERGLHRQFEKHLECMEGYYGGIRCG